MKLWMMESSTLRHLAFVPADEGVPVEELVRKIAGVLEAMGRSTAVITGESRDRDATWLHDQEARHDVLLYVADLPRSTWTKRCLRQTDTAVLVVSAQRAATSGSRLCDEIGATTPEYALYGFAIFYALCLVLNWWFYLRPNAYVKNP